MEKLFAGAAKTAITPDKALLKALVAESHRNLTGIYEDIYVRVIILSDGLQKVALITVDLNRFPAHRLAGKIPYCPSLFYNLIKFHNPSLLYA